MKESAYKEAGVDIKAGADVVDRIKPHIRKTMRDGVMDDVGGFGAFFDPAGTGYRDPLLVSSTDGVGTKLKVAIESGIHDTVGVDLVAMCVNDIIVQGAEPLFFLDYFATGKLDPATAETVISGVARGCSEAGCALIGGETAEMPGLYGEGDYDLAGFTVGAVERQNVVTGARIKAGDTVLGLASNGIHSNGFSLVRRLVEGAQGYGYDAPASFANGKTVAEALLEPTRIYVKPMLAALDVREEDGAQAVRGMAHITGGGLLENIPRILPEGLAVNLDAESWPFLPVFQWLGEAGRLSETDLAQTFNCGIGFVIVCSPDYAQALTHILSKEGESVYSIGKVTEREGNPAVTIENTDTAWLRKS